MIPAYFLSSLMSTFLLITLSLITLLMISTGVFLLSKRFNFPYTVSLVGVGLLIALVSEFSIFAFLDDFRLTPDILLYIFLPILLFESAYNIKYKEMLRSAKAISLLAIVSLIVSAFLIAVFVHYGALLFGYHIPFLVALLFGTLISATDPVAVLALFKELGAPRRLTLIFEGESLFNDGTAFALFLVILAYLESVSGFASDGHGNLYSIVANHLFGTGTGGLIITGIISFLLMILVGMLFGSFIGVVFSKIIEKIKNNEFLEIMLTLILAHTTFILAEVLNHFLLPVSGVIATTLAALVVGNYGRYKISPKVEETMERFWGFFAFISNSLVFLLVGIMIVSLGIDWKVMTVPVVIAIAAVIIARDISVYGIIVPLNWTKTEEDIPVSWLHMLSWGSLRGALAIIMVLLIPESLTLAGWDFPFSIRDFVLALTVGCIVFTTFIKATTIIPLMKHFNIDKLHEIEQVEHVEGKMIMFLEVLAKIGSLKERGYIIHEEYMLLFEKYSRELEGVRQELDELMQEKGEAITGLIKRVITLHALGIEKFSLKKLYMYNEISEREFKILLRKNESQIRRVETGLPQIKGADEKDTVNIFERLTETVSAWLHRDVNPILSRFILVRSRLVMTDSALKGLIVFEGVDFIAGRKEFREIQELYKSFHESAQKEHSELFAENKDLLIEFDSELANKSLLKQQEIIVEDLFQKEIISPKLYIRFKEEIEEKIYE